MLLRKCRINQCFLKPSYTITGLKSVQQGLCTEIILLLMSPFYLYAAFTYTDVYGLLPAVLVFACAEKALLKCRERFQPYLWAALAGMVSAVGFLIEGTVSFIC